MRLRLPIIFSLIGVSSASTFAQTWNLLPTTNDPTPRRNASAVYDPMANQMVVFGGVDSTGNKNDLWALNLSTMSWQMIAPSTSTIPQSRFSHNAMMDSALNRMLVWSGQGSGLYNDVWAFNFSDSTWIQLWANGNVSGAPLTRYGTAAILDHSKRRLVNFAGFTSDSGRYKDTWYFHVDSSKWSNQTYATNPGLRCLHSATFAPENRKMIIYGGQRSGPLDDIWSLDLDAFQWTDLTPTTKPSGRYFASIVYAGNGQVIMYGGQTAAGTSEELWQFSLSDNSWFPLFQGSLKPSARQGHTAIYVPSTNKMIIFGGTSGNLLNDAWELSLSTTGLMRETGIPADFSLEQNFPNPFNPVTRIQYRLPQSGITTLKVFDILGKEVASLVQQEQERGLHEMVFDAAFLPSGIYLYRLTQGYFIASKRMALVK
ncbi:MAG: T9SS type A sorting domain-containing protein [Ignavibacteriales bacterium]|nr:T9SS type A sorting domain-containing protein [Ignavibacteriales bacterium]